MPNNDHDLGLLIGELKAIRESLDGMKASFAEFKSGFGTRIGSVEEKINQFDVVKDRVDWILKIGAWVIAPTIATLVFALLKVILSK